MTVSRRSALVLSMLLAASGISPAQDFSGDVVDLQKPGSPTLAKLYVSKDRTRIEFQSASGDRALVTPLQASQDQKEPLEVQINGEGKTIILNSGDKTTVILDAEHKIYTTGRWGNPAPNRLYTLYTVRIADPEDFCAEMMKGKGEGMSCKKSGYEPVDGRRAVRYETSVSGEDASLWFDLGLHILVKRKNRWTNTELHNVREQAQPSNLFEIPKDYTPTMKLGGIIGRFDPE